MFGLNPAVLYLIIGLLVANGLTALGWKMASSRADKVKQELTICVDRYQSFRDQTESLGKAQAAGVKQLIEVSDAVNKETEQKYEASLVRIRNDFSWLRKQRTSGNPGSGAVPAIPDAPTRIDDIPTNCLPLGEQSAVTTLMLVDLQGWIRKQAAAYAERQ